MLIKHRNRHDLTENDVTPQSTYLKRRAFLASAMAAGILPAAAQAATKKERDLKPLETTSWPGSTGESQTPVDKATRYNNYYEFGTDKSAPAKNAHSLITDPWSVNVTGAVAKPGRYWLEELVSPQTLEERIYRLRCVEAWSMVIPWVGFPLKNIMDMVEPTSKAKYVAFKTLYDRTQMPGTRWNVLDWPYREGLRIDEAANPLTLMAVGMYGRELPNQNGAPLRLVVPWKYGFKSIKSIVEIAFVEEQPKTSWNMSAPREYGFYSNVNPDVPHPRWSQASERRLDGDGFMSMLKRRETLPFNGYGEQVADMYSGMDLRKFY